MIRWLVKRVVDALEAEGVRVRPVVFSVGGFVSAGDPVEGGEGERGAHLAGWLDEEDGSDSVVPFGSPREVLRGFARPDNLRDGFVGGADEPDVAGDGDAVHGEGAVHDSPSNGDDPIVGGAS